MKALTLTFAGLVGLGAVALALTASAQMDADGDGIFTYEELVAVYPDLTAEAYATLDTNADGAVDEAELTAAVDAGILPSQG